MEYFAAMDFGSYRVHPASTTPYTDATQCRKIVKHTKRPMNAFMVWSQMERRIITSQTPSMHNALISKELGARWRNLTEAQKQPAKDEAERLQKLHLLEYPDYKYRPQKKVKNSSAGSVASTSGTKLTKTMKAAPRQRKPLKLNIDSCVVASKRRMSSVELSSIASSGSPTSSINSPSDVSEHRTPSPDVKYFDDNIFSIPPFVPSKSEIQMEIDQLSLMNINEYLISNDCFNNLNLGDNCDFNSHLESDALGNIEFDQLGGGRDIRVSLPGIPGMPELASDYLSDIEEIDMKDLFPF